jgi:hypothetical protein
MHDLKHKFSGKQKKIHIEQGIESDKRRIFDTFLSFRNLAFS